MTDEEFDEQIRSRLITLIDEARDPLPYPVVARRAHDRSEPDGGSPRDHRPRTRRLIAAAAVIVVLVAGFAIRSTQRDGSQDLVTSGESERHGFRSWDPGWHDLDTGSVPGLNVASMTFLNGSLFVAGTTGQPSINGDLGGADGHAVVYRFDPDTEEWQQLPDPQMHYVAIVATGDSLVAVGPVGPIDQANLAGPALWSTWTPGADAWVAHGNVVRSTHPAATQLDLVSMSRASQLVWTGRRVIDITHASVLDPATGTSTPLEMPTHLADTAWVPYIDPVWTGSELVMSAWSSRTGLAWSADGTFLRELPPPPGAPPVDVPTMAAPVNGSVVILAIAGGDGSNRVTRVDPATGSWTPLPDLPVSIAPPLGCSFLMGTADDHLVVAPFSGSVFGSEMTLVLDGDKWDTRRAGPTGIQCGSNATASGPDALAMYALATPTAARISVWIPSRG